MQDIIHNTDKRVSIQIDLSGYSFIVQNGNAVTLRMQESLPSGNSDFSAVVDSLSQALVKVGISKYENLSVEVFYLTRDYVLVPEEFYSENGRESCFKEMHGQAAGKVLSAKLPFYEGIVILYTIPDAILKLSDISDAKMDFYPSIYSLLRSNSDLTEYNKVTMDYRTGLVSVAVADRENLLLCNSFVAEDFDTALYYVLNAVKTLNLNPEQSVLYSLSPMSVGQMDKARRFLRDVVLL